MAITLGDVLVHIGGNMNPLKREFKLAKDATNVFSRTVETAVGVGMANVALKLAGGVASAVASVGRGVTSFISEGVKSGAELEQQIADIASFAGKSKDEVYGPLKKLLGDIALNPQIKASFGEAASAAEMLVRNGVELQQVMDGAAEQTILLANATGLSGQQMGLAADIYTDVVTQFGLSGGVAEEALHRIAGATTNSKFSIQDFGYALGQAGGVAGAVGVEFDDFTTTIAGTASSFSGGSDAGTSFKTFLQRLPGVSAPAMNALRELSIITADGSNRFFTASGEMKSMSEIAGILEQALDGVSDKDRNELLADAFGTDAIRTATSLADLGRKGFEDLQKQIGQVDVYEMAAARTGTLAAAMDTFWDSLNGLRMMMFEKFNPALQTIFQTLSDVVAAVGPRILEFFGSVAAKFEEMVNFVAPLVLQLADAFNENGLAGVFDALGGVVMTFVENFKKQTEEATPGLLGWLLEKVGWLFTQLVNAVIFYFTDIYPKLQPAIEEMRNNFYLAMLDFIEGALKWLGEFADAVLAWASGDTGMGDTGNALADEMLSGLEFLVTNQERINEILDLFIEVLGEVAMAAGAALLRIGGEMAWNLVAGMIGIYTSPEAVSGMDKAFHESTLGQIVMAPATWGKRGEDLGTAVGTKMGKALMWAGELVEETVSEWFNLDVMTLEFWIGWATEMTTGFVETVLEILPTIKNGISAKIQEWIDIIHVHVDYIKSFFSIEKWVQMGADIISGIIRGVKQKINDLIAGMFGAISDMYEGAKRAAGIASPSKLFAEGVGAPLAEGIGIGFGKQFDKERQRIASQVQDFSNKLTKSVNEFGSRQKYTAGQKGVGQYVYDFLKDVTELDKTRGSVSGGEYAEFSKAFKAATGYDFDSTREATGGGGQSWGTYLKSITDKETYEELALVISQNRQRDARDAANAADYAANNVTNVTNKTVNLNVTQAYSESIIPELEMAEAML